MNTSEIGVVELDAVEMRATEGGNLLWELVKAAAEAAAREAAEALRRMMQPQV